MNYYFGQEQPDGGSPTGPDGFFRVFDTLRRVHRERRSCHSASTSTTRPTRCTRAIASCRCTGFGVYARYQVSAPAALWRSATSVWTTRGCSAASKQILQEVTFTLEYKFADGFLVRGEFRRDWSNQPFFTGRGAGDLQDRPEHAPRRPGVVVGQQDRAPGRTASRRC